MSAAMEHNTSDFMHHVECESCGSSDANGVYTDGHTHCFSCNAHTSNGEGSPLPPTTKTAPKRALVVGGEPWSGRKLTVETCKKFGYLKGEDSYGNAVHIAPFYDAAGIKCAQKLRYPKDPETGKKKFSWVGHKKDSTLFGQQLWKNGGRKLIITEGEIDCLSVSQVQDNKWPVVSVLDGASNAAQSIRDNLEFVEGFEEVILMFDMDEPGRLAAQEVAEDVLSPGKAFIAHLDEGDANAMLTAGKGHELRQAIWSAKKYTPEGFVDGGELWDIMNDDTNQVASQSYPWEFLNVMGDGMRFGEIVTLTGAPCSGKSTFGRQLMAHQLEQGHVVGVIALEESLARVGWDMVGLHMGRQLHRTREGADPEMLRKSYEATLGTGRLHLYNHQGVTGEATLITKIRVMAKVLGCKFILLDHLTVALTQVGSEQSNERLLIDSCMTQLAVLAGELDINICIVVHLKRTDDKFAEGAPITMSDVRGSSSIESLSDVMLACERDQQSEDMEVRNRMRVRVLKDRWTGETGVAGYLAFDKETGRLNVTDAPKKKEQDLGFKATAGHSGSDPSDF